MPDVDVSWVLDDGMVATSFSVLRTPALRNGKPDTANATVMTGLTGAVMPGTIEPIQQADDATRATRWINIHTRTQLFDATAGFMPDVVQYLGNNWKVMKPYDYSEFGSGFYAYDAMLQDLAGAVAS